MQTNAPTDFVTLDAVQECPPIPLLDQLMELAAMMPDDSPQRESVLFYAACLVEKHFMPQIVSGAPATEAPENHPNYFSDGPGVTGIELLVCQDIERRQMLGIAKYGQTVAENPLKHREWLQHAYEEALDMAVYLKRAIAAHDGREF